MSMTLSVKSTPAELKALIASYTGPITTAKAKKGKRHFSGFSNTGVRTPAAKPTSGR